MRDERDESEGRVSQRHDTSIGCGYCLLTASAAKRGKANLKERIKSITFLLSHLPACDDDDGDDIVRLTAGAYRGEGQRSRAGEGPGDPVSCDGIVPVVLILMPHPPDPAPAPSPLRECHCQAT